MAGNTRGRSPSEYTKEQVEAAMSGAKTMAQYSRNLGCSFNVAKRWMFTFNLQSNFKTKYKQEHQFLANATADRKKKVSSEDRWSKDSVKKAIVGSHGFISTISKKLGCSHNEAKNQILKFELEDLLVEEKDNLLDFTEGKLVANINDGLESSIFFYLKTQGKGRGYDQTQQPVKTQESEIKLEIHNHSDSTISTKEL